MGDASMAVPLKYVDRAGSGPPTGLAPHADSPDATATPTAVDHHRAERDENLRN
jgi:hypothetical protein